MLGARHLTQKQPAGIGGFLLAVMENLAFAVLAAPVAFADRLSDGGFLDALPTFNTVCGQASDNLRRGRDRLSSGSYGKRMLLAAINAVCRSKDMNRK
jgi:hypothetical protein